MPAGAAQRGGWWQAHARRLAHGGPFGCVCRGPPVTTAPPCLGALRRRRDRPLRAGAHDADGRRRAALLRRAPASRPRAPAGMAVSRPWRASRLEHAPPGWSGWTVPRSRPALHWDPAACPRPSVPAPTSCAGRAPRFGRSSAFRSWCSGRSLPARCCVPAAFASASPRPWPDGVLSGRPRALAPSGLRSPRQSPRSAARGRPQAAAGAAGTGAGSGCAPGQPVTKRDHKRRRWHGRRRRESPRMTGAGASGSTPLTTPLAPTRASSVRQAE